MQSINITEDAIQKLTREVEEDITVQVIHLKKLKSTNRLSGEISDGNYKIRAFITDPKVQENDNYAFITITSYGMLYQHERPMGLVVHTCDILDVYTEELGKPIDYLKERNNGSVPNKENKIVIDPHKLKSYQNKNPQFNTQKKAQQPRPIENGRIQPSTNEHMNEEGGRSYNPIVQTPIKQQVRISHGEVDNLQNYEKISDLYPDFPNWQIVARLIKKNYRQFISKSGKGKLTKVLNVQFMDSTGMKITGAMFGDSAKQFYDALKQQSVYIISKGQIREQQFNQNKGRNYSRYTLMFTRQSQFKICQDTKLVPHSQKTLHDLLYVSQNRNIGQEYDVVAILLSIHEQVQIPKDNKTLYKQVMQICDPINDLRMQAIIWNRNLIIDQRIVGKTVGLFGFRFNQFNEKISLNSSFQSEIKVLESHKYKKYEGRVDREKMEMLSENKKDGQEIEEACKNLKELENQIVYLEEGKEIRSTLTLIVTFIGYKKWSYESCPYCRKSAQAGNRCNGCDKYIEETIPKYKLNVELSDYCGSIWATGFDELGSKLFGDYPDGIKGINSLDQVQRHRLFEQRQYQQFTVKLTSKLDRDGQIKHTLNRIYDCNMITRIQQNIKRIKNHGR